MMLSLAFLCVLIIVCEVQGIKLRPISSTKVGLGQQQRRKYMTAAILPGPSIVTGTFALGILNAAKIYQSIIYASIALSWFPQLPRQFKFLRPIFTVTEPYLRIFRSVIPPIAGFDISVIPAVFVLDIVGNTAAALGDEMNEKIQRLCIKNDEFRRKLFERSALEESNLKTKGSKTI